MLILTSCSLTANFLRETWRSCVIQIEYTKGAVKDLRRIDRKVRRRILEKIEAYARNDSLHVNNVKALVNTEGYRLRVGDYRVLFTLEGGTMTIMVVRRVRHRRDAYDR